MTRQRGCRRPGSLPHRSRMARISLKTSIYRRVDFSPRWIILKRAGEPIRVYHSNSSLTPGGQHRAAPCLGEHTEMILRDILHLSEADVAALEQSGTISNVPPGATPSAKVEKAKTSSGAKSMSSESESSAADVVLLERRDGVAWLTLNRPRVLNAINSDMRRRLTALLQNLDQDPDVRAIVLGGAGRSFCRRQRSA